MLTADMLREKAGEEEFALGKALFHRALVREARRTKEEAAYIVSEEDTTHVVRVSASGVRCDCGGRMCRHGVAAELAAIESGVMQEMEKRRAQMAVPALFEAVSSALPEAPLGSLRYSACMFGVGCMMEIYVFPASIFSGDSV